MERDVDSIGTIAAAGACTHGRRGKRRDHQEMDKGGVETREKERRKEVRKIGEEEMKLFYKMFTKNVFELK